MALTFTANPTAPINTVQGARRQFIGFVTFDNSYPTGGEAIAASDFNLSRIDMVLVGQPVGSTRIVTWDDANSKLKVYTALSTEATNASDQSAIKVPVIVIGI